MLINANTRGVMIAYFSEKEKEFGADLGLGWGFVHKG